MFRSASCSRRWVTVFCMSVLGALELTRCSSRTICATMSSILAGEIREGFVVADVRGTGPPGALRRRWSGRRGRRLRRGPSVTPPPATSAEATGAGAAAGAAAAGLGRARRRPVTAPDAVRRRAGGSLRSRNGRGLSAIRRGSSWGLQPQACSQPARGFSLRRRFSGRPSAAVSACGASSATAGASSRLPRHRRPGHSSADAVRGAGLQDRGFLGRCLVSHCRFSRGGRFLGQVCCCFVGFLTVCHR